MQCTEYWETVGWAGSAPFRLTEWSWANIIQSRWRGRTERGYTTSSWWHIHVALGIISSVELEFEIIWNLITATVTIGLFWWSNISLGREHWQWSHSDVSLTVFIICVVGRRWACRGWRWLSWSKNNINWELFNSCFLQVMNKMTSWSVWAKSGCVIGTTQIGFIFWMSWDCSQFA